MEKRTSRLTWYQSHQNKFHSDTLRNLTQRFASMREGDAVTAMDKELWEYFATLYKNSNKGIKGRGKDRRIFATNRDDDDKQGRRSRSSSSDCSGHDTSEISENGREKDDSCSSGSVESDEHEQNFIHENNASQGLQGAATM